MTKLLNNQQQLLKHHHKEEQHVNAKEELDKCFGDLKRDQIKSHADAIEDVNK